MAYNDSIDWKNVIKTGQEDLATLTSVKSIKYVEITQLQNQVWLTKKYMTYDIPRSFVEKFDRQRLLLRITKEESESLQDQGIMA